MNVARPLCATCFKRHREPGTSKCSDCGPGRIYSPAPPRRRPRQPTPAELLGDPTPAPDPDPDRTTP